MNIFNRLFKKKKDNTVGGVEDFMLLIRVYYQATIAAQIGINNLAALPDLRIFKQTYHVATLNNKLGLAEKKQCQKMLQSIYNSSDSQDLMMLMGNLMQWKFRLPSFFHKALRTMVEKQVHDIMTRNDWKDDAVRRACASVRKYQASLSYSEAWMTEYVHTTVMLAKKENRPQNME